MWCLASEHLVVSRLGSAIYCVIKALLHDIAESLFPTYKMCMINTWGNLATRYLVHIVSESLGIILEARDIEFDESGPCPQDSGGIAM